MTDLCGSLLSFYTLSLARILLYPSYVTFNWLACLYVTTFEENRHPTKILARKLLLTPVHGTLFILSLPLFVIFLPIRCLILTYRQPFMYSERHTPYTEKQAKIMREFIRKGCHRFGIASANLCLMPEVASRMNNLVNVDGRAKKIGEKIAVSQFFNDFWIKRELWWRMNSDKKGEVPDGIVYRNDEFNENNSHPDDPTTLVGDVTTQFPYLDFFVVQEAWSRYHNKALIDELHKLFPYIVHDVGAHSLKNNNFVLNSGLLLASKHPIVAVDFKPYSSYVKHGKLLSLGLLMVKVYLGRSTSNKNLVGYIFNTHLQSYQGKEPIIPKQLNEILLWVKAFTKENTEAGDKVLFELICGDFNFDNLSPADVESTRHKVFDEYVDICRQTPGCDKAWTVGTEMRQNRMFDSLVSTPDGLKAALDDRALRQCHIIDGDIVEHTHEALAFGDIKMDEQNNVMLIPEGGRRRIDYIIYQRSFPVNVEAFHFVTQLATLTDHIPIAMEFTCPASN